MKVSDELLYSDLADAVLALAKFHLSGGRKGDGSYETCQKALSASALISVMTVNYDVHRQADIREGIEMAAKVCERKAQEFLSPQYAVGQPLSSFQERFACGECATAIRALAGEVK